MLGYFNGLAESLGGSQQLVCFSLGYVDSKELCGQQGGIAGQCIARMVVVVMMMRRIVVTNERLVVMVVVVVEIKQTWTRVVR